MIILAATPIGNIEDASSRLVQALSNVDVIAAEDTRTTLKLMNALNISHRPQLISLHEHNERTEAQAIVDIARNKDVLVLSDAGMPSISDPGYVIVLKAIEADITVTALPGPSAVITALALSGLPTDRFCFEGFLPRKSGERKKTLESLIREQRTMVFFESPHRLRESLEDMVSVFGPDRKGAVCREMTKMYEEVKRGTLNELAEWFEGTTKGEIVIVVSGAEAITVSLEEGLGEVKALVAGGMKLKEASAAVSEDTGLSRRELYEAMLKLPK